MMKQRTIIEVEVSGRQFRLECASESTWQEVQAALMHLTNYANETAKRIVPQPEVITENVEAA